MPMWWNKKVECGGAVIFRGTLPPRLDELPSLEPLGFSVEGLGGNTSGIHWSLNLKGPQGADVQLAALRNPPRLPRALVDMSIDLSPEEREFAVAGEATIGLRMQGARDNLFSDRKMFLRLLGAIMGRDGLIAIDNTSQKFWSRAALDDELLHDADVDIDALYNLHAVGDEGELIWIHTHGLAEIGMFDFDLIRPSPVFAGLQIDGIRAIALAIAQGDLKPGGAPFLFAGDNVRIQAIEAATFDKLARGADRTVREGAEADHVDNRCVICEPVSFVSRVMGKRVMPARYFQSEPDERQPLHFSSDAGRLMAERARGSLPVLKRIMAEFADLQFTVAAKIGYPIDGGGPNDLEHMWFEVHGIDGDTLDATLAVQPFNISRMKHGDRGRHSIARLTDWLMPTPAGNITPRSTAAARRLRPHLAELRAAMSEEADGSIPLEDR